MRAYRPFIAILALVVLGIAGIPTQTRASITGPFQDFASCAGSTAMTQLVSGLFDKIPGLGSFLGTGDVPVKDNALNTFQSRKEVLKDVAARCGARVVLNSSIKSILNVARDKGRDGGSTFVRNFRNFITGGQYRGENILRGILANTQLCGYLSRDIQDIFGVTKKDKISLKGQNIRVNDLDPFTLRAKCSLSEKFDLEKFRGDFTGNGGWATLTRMLQPENNIYGTLLQSLNELEKQKAVEVASDLNEYQAGRGYTSVRGNSASDSCLVKAGNGKCLFYADVKTPASAIADSVAATVQQELAWITNVDELNELVVNATSVLLNRLLDLGNPNEGDYQLYADPVVQFTCVKPPAPAGSGGTPSPQEMNDLRRQLDQTTEAILHLYRLQPNSVSNPKFNDPEYALGLLDSVRLRPINTDTDKVDVDRTTTAVVNHFIETTSATDAAAMSGLLQKHLALLDRIKQLMGIFDKLDSGAQTETCPPDPTDESGGGGSTPGAGGELTAVCSGGSTPTVTLVWAARAGASSNSLQRQTAGGSFEFIFQDQGPPFTTFAYADTTVSTGTSYTYRVKYSPSAVSNSVSITPTAATCNQPAPVIPGGGGTGGGGGTSNPGECSIVPGRSNKYQSEVRAAIVTIATTTTGILDPNDIGANSYHILSLDAYHAQMLSILSGQGFTVLFDGEELNIYRQGDTTSQQYHIDTSFGVTAYKNTAEGCPLP